MAIRRVELDLKSLSDLDDGRLAVALAQQLRMAALDCHDRPGDKSARVVAMVFAIKPVLGELGDCDSTEMEVQFKCRLPTRKSKTYCLDLTKKGQMSFNADFPESLDQQPLPFDEA